PSTFPLGDTIVIWTVTDAAGNTTTCTQTVTVTDDEDPVIATCPADVTANTSDDGTGNCTTTVALGTPVSNDNCSVATTEAQVNGTTIDPITFEFGLGDTTVTWLITDGSGNTTTCTQTVTVTDDENPTITCPANISVNIDAAACDVSTVNLGTPITDDNCSVASVTNDAPSTYPLGDTIVTWTVTDGSGNTATCTQTVTVIDNVDPTISCPANISVSADAGLCSASGVNLGTPTTSDCVVSTVTNDAPSTFPLGDTIVTWTVTDSSGNSASCTQTVTVTDDENPTITCPADVSVTADTDSCETLAAN
ncbi:HYR domain-containing protein, partial [Jejuia pallidilutea]